MRSKIGAVQFDNSLFCGAGAMVEAVVEFDVEVKVWMTVVVDVCALVVVDVT
jgi:hypothetical protein